MHQQKTVQDVLKFIDYLEAKSFVPKNSAFGKKAAISKFTEGLTTEESTVEYLSQNFDSVAHRFRTKNTGAIQGSSLETYESRTRAAIEDYKLWVADAAAWEKQHVAKKSGKASGAASKSSAKPKAKVSMKGKIDSAELQGSTDDSKLNPTMRKLVLPIGEIDFIVEIPNKGFTIAQLTRLGMFLAPYCEDFSPSRTWNLVTGEDDGNH